MNTPLRVLVANWTNRLAGGAERYIQSVLPEIERGGHEVAFLHELEEPAAHGLIQERPHRSWSVDRLGAAGVVAEAREWGPDVVFVHGLLDPALERSVQQLAPAVLVAHSYYGTCISGIKTWRTPVARTCVKPFGLDCMLHYYPHRCGGLNPLTMLRQYRVQRDRNELLREYRAVVTLSDYMRREMEQAGARAIHIPVIAAAAATAVEVPRRPIDEPWRLLFVGRLQEVKGGEVFLESLPLVRKATGAELSVVFAGDGPDRPKWQRRAGELSGADPRLTIEFTGWLEGDALESQWRQADLLAFPSIWPEPFGLVGMDASRHGIPVVGFRVGAVPEWIEDGVNGVLAPANPTTAQGFADAIVRVIGSPDAYENLCVTTRKRGSRPAMREHARDLLVIFESIRRDGDRAILARQSG
jgi:glycosyltransferase involved in cell wall biosynthesis